MKGKEHMIVGTTATATMGIGFVITKDINNIVYLAPLILGGFIGSYMPDIDSHTSTAHQVFNKIIAIFIIGLFIGYSLGLAINIEDVIIFFDTHWKENISIIFLGILILLGKLSPHRMFTHKWFGTCLFCYSVYLLGNDYFALGFAMGYILHIVCDRFTARGKNLKFFQFKLPCKNSKNKLTISW